MFITSFSTTLQGWAYVAAFGLLYFAYSVVFTMNDIAYWGMVPALGAPRRRPQPSYLPHVCGRGGSFWAASLYPRLRRAAL